MWFSKIVWRECPRSIPLTESIAHLGKDVSKQMWKNINVEKHFVRMTDLTEFQKIKIKEWEEFGKQYPFSWTREIKDSWLYVVYTF